MKIAPGSSSRYRSLRGVESCSITSSTPVVSTTVATSASHFTAPPGSPPKICRLLPRLDSVATTTRDSPASTSHAAPRSRLITGLSRLLRGIPHVTLTVFCAACPSPMMP